MAKQKPSSKKMSSKEHLEVAKEMLNKRLSMKSITNEKFIIQAVGHIDQALERLNKHYVHTYRKK